MFDPKEIHWSLDDAREELAKRWQNEELKKAIEEELGENFWPEFKNEPRGFIAKPLVSPDNGFTFFVQCAHYVNVKPVVFELLDDIFVTVNEEKLALGRLSVTLDKGEKKLLDVIDFGSNEKRKMEKVILKTGEKVIDFHHNLINIAGYDIERVDKTQWVRKIGKPSDFYYPYLLHCVAHGVLFENIFIEGSEDEKESEFDFMDNVIIAAIEKIKQKYGLKPLIVRLFPDRQSPEEDFYWWNYPPHVNDYLIEYAEKNQLKLKNWHE